MSHVAMTTIVKVLNIVKDKAHFKIFKEMLYYDPCIKIGNEVNMTANDKTMVLNETDIDHIVLETKGLSVDRP